MLSCSCLTRCLNRPALLEKTLRTKDQFLCSSWQLPPRIFKRPLSLSSQSCTLSVAWALPSTPRHHDGILTRQNHLPKLSPCAHVAQVQMSRGTLTCLSQTGEGFLLTFDPGRQDANKKNSHGMGVKLCNSHGTATEWINDGARPQKLQTTN